MTSKGAISFLDEPIQFLKGVGPKRADVLREAGVATINDLLSYYPRRYLDRTNVVAIRNVRPGAEPVTIVGKVVSTRVIPGRRGRRFELVVEDEPLRRLTCVWFQGVAWISKVFEPGHTVALHGKPQKFGTGVSLAHPEFDRLEEAGPSLDTGRIIAIYPGSQALQTAGVTSRTLRRIIYDLFRERGEELDDFLPLGLVQAYDLEDGRVARRAVHFPKTQDELRRARERLKFEEFFFFQLMLARLKYGVKKESGPVFEGPGMREDVAHGGPGAVRGTTGPGPDDLGAAHGGPGGAPSGPAYAPSLLARFISEVLPFTLTRAQLEALRDIQADISSGARMNRLLQGDVGSGKTVVAVAAALLAVDAEYQVAFMAPTEILAEQHATTLRKMLEPLRVPVALLTGSTSRADRGPILEGIRTGAIPIVVGTHAVIQDTVEFHRLGLGIVDEQHRFGVMQRATLFGKGIRPHVLLMTATPIPRSLALTLYGDLDVSIMRERPPGRQPVRTRVLREKHRPEVHAFMREQMAEGRQCYVVYPLVGESEKLDLKDAISGFEALKAAFAGFKVDLVHGQMKSSEKETVMSGFTSGKTAILVSTTVIEVGVDVPNATVMVIEHAERFGLSQLHQLRGRIGRGIRDSTCFLMADYRQSNESRDRLETMEKTEDGFVISEKDLELRGTGDVFGTRQSGLPGFRIADPLTDRSILERARKAAFEVIDRDPNLEAPDARALRDYFTTFVMPKGLQMSRIG